jgi:hypothetical protein
VDGARGLLAGVLVAKVDRLLVVGGAEQGQREVLCPSRDTLASASPSRTEGARPRGPAPRSLETEIAGPAAAAVASARRIPDVQQQKASLHGP